METEVKPAWNEALVCGWPDTKEWFQARTTGIGASEIAAASGIGGSPLEIYCLKRGITSDNLDDIEYVQMGKFAEPGIKRAFTWRTGLKLLHETCPMLRHPEYPEILCTPDAIVEDGNPLECKNVNYMIAQRYLGEDLTDEIRPEWTCQTQIQMEILERDTAHVAALVGGHKLRVFTVRRNDRLIKLLIDRARELWRRIQEGDPPPVDPSHGSVTALVKAMYPEVTEGDVVELPPECAQKWMEAKAIDKEISALEAKRDALKDAVKLEMRDAQVARFAGCEFELVRKVVPRKGYSVEPTTYVTVTQRKVKIHGQC